MKFRVADLSAVSHPRSAFRIIKQTTGREVDWVLGASLAVAAVTLRVGAAE
jgi:hypothetical protein